MNKISLLPQSLKTGMKICIDFEWYEKTSGKHPTELGLGMMGGEEVGEDIKHFLIKENQNLKNRFVPQRPHNFKFGTTKTITMEQTRHMLLQMIHQDQVTLIGHNLAGDLRVLNKTFGVCTKHCELIDTAKLFKTLCNSRKYSLEYACQAFNINLPTDHWHNAGNDVYYTQKLFQALISHSSLIQSSDASAPSQIRI